MRCWRSARPLKIGYLSRLCLSQVSTIIIDNILEVIICRRLLPTFCCSFFCDSIVHISSKRFMIAYAIGREILSQLGEDIPETLSSNQNTTLMTATIKMVKGISDKNFLGMKEMDSNLARCWVFFFSFFF